MNSYSFYLGESMLLPVAPAKLEIKYGNKLKKIDLVSGEEIVFQKGGKLAEISFTAMLPEVHYPFAEYHGGFRKGSRFLWDMIDMKKSGEPFRFIVLRGTPWGDAMFPTNIKVVFSHLSVREDAGEGTDLYADVKLTEFRDFAVGNVQPSAGFNAGSGSFGDSGGGFESTAQTPLPVTRPVDSQPVTKTYTVIKGDTLWMLAHKFLGDGNRYKELYNINKSVIDSGNKGTGNPVYTIYPKQVFKVSL